MIKSTCDLVHVDWTSRLAQGLTGRPEQWQNAQWAAAEVCQSLFKLFKLCLHQILSVLIAQHTQDMPQPILKAK